MLVGAAAALAATAAPLHFAWAATPPVRRAVGAISVTAISDGSLLVPLSMSLPDVSTSDAASLFTAHGLPPGGSPVPTNVSLVATGD